MNPVVILDTDFLSAFLKIERLPLVRHFYQVETLHIPLAVYQEIVRTPLLLPLLAFPWVEVVASLPTPALAVDESHALTNLGQGERAAIGLALRSPASMLLTNDNKARRVAADLGIAAVNIPAFLLACKWAGLLDPAAMQQVIGDLWQRDRYRFRQDVQRLLLS